MRELEKLFMKMLNEVEKAQKEREKQSILSEQDLRELIDLALVLDDKEWFMELTEKLNAMTA